MPSLHRLATGALLKETPRKVSFASFNHSAVLSSAALSAEQSASPNIPKIFDIFDSPVKLRGENTHNGPEPLKPFSSSPTARVTSRGGSIHSQSILHDALGLPWSLPPPITFDGPACPPHMSASTLRERRLRRQGLPHPPTRNKSSSVVSCSALTSQSETLYQVFDGPSRVTRFQYPTSGNERHSFTYLPLALCLSTAFGWLALEESLKRNKKNPAGLRVLSSSS